MSNTSFVIVIAIIMIRYVCYFVSVTLCQKARTGHCDFLLTFYYIAWWMSKSTKGKKTLYMLRNSFSTSR